MCVSIDIQYVEKKLLILNSEIRTHTRVPLKCGGLRFAQKGGNFACLSFSHGKKQAAPVPKVGWGADSLQDPNKVIPDFYDTGNKK